MELLERSSFLDVLAGYAAEAKRGSGRLVLVSGEAGIGKTALCAEFARAVYAEDATVLYGRCDEELGVPYQPWIEALTHLVRGAPQAVTRRDAGELAGLVPAVRDVLPGVGASVAAIGQARQFPFCPSSCGEMRARKR